MARARTVPFRHARAAHPRGPWARVTRKIAIKAAGELQLKGSEISNN